MLRIGVLFGGISVEHDISIISAIQVLNAIDKSKYEVIPLYLTKTGNLLYGDRYSNIDTFKKEIKPKKREYVNLMHFNNKGYLSFAFQKFKKRLKMDLILPIMHGKGVEDGNISGFLEILKIPYFSCKVLPASICQDKEFTKVILENLNIKTVPYEVIYSEDEKLKNNIYPQIIKPARLGSSIGIKKVNSEEERLLAVKDALHYDNKVIVEKALTHFKEYSVALYMKKEELIISDIEEINTKDDIYKFTDKYESGQKDISVNKLPAKISKKQTEKIYEIVRKIYTRLELSGIVRIDFLYDSDLKELYVNEINTIPGSLAFYLFKDKGITFTNLIDDLIKQTLIEEEKKKEYIASFESNILNKNTLKMKK